MKKLNQRIIDFCLDHAHLNDEDFREKLTNAVITDEKLTFNHENFSLKEALNITKETHQKILDNFTFICMQRGRKSNSEIVESFFVMPHKELAFITYELFTRVPTDQLIR
jgi:uncharacterized protein (DUF1919 family)